MTASTLFLGVFFGPEKEQHRHAANDRDEEPRLRAQTPDLVLIDIQMPVMDGLEATRLLKADPATASIPVLAVTALAMPEDAHRCFEAGCDGYLTKPFTPGQFETAIRDALDSSATVRT